MDYYLSLESLVVEYQKHLVNVLIVENKLLANDLKKETFPLGGLVYVIDLSKGYKIGVIKNLQRQKQVYDTGMIHKSNVVH